MAGSAAGRDAGGGRNHAALGGVLGNLVQIRGNGGFKGGEVILFFGGDVAQTVENDQSHFGFNFKSQLGIKFIQIHSSNSAPGGRLSSMDFNEQ